MITIKLYIMKKLFLLPAIAIAVSCLLVFAGCTKDNVMPMASDSAIPNDSKKKSMRKAPNFGDLYTDEQKSGMITGVILPIDAEARVFLSNAASIELLVDSTGTIQSQQVPAGEYNVDIIPGNYYYGSYSISNIIVASDSATNLGTITLEYYGGGGSGCEIGWGRQKR